MIVISNSIVTRSYPVSFKPSMVAAILENKKTQTRRLATNKKWQAGDHLWVQEDYFLRVCDENIYQCFYRDGFSKLAVLSEAEHYKLLNRKTPPEKKQPGRFMYKSCSRITLDVVNTRIERLQDISEEDAIAEGIQPLEYQDGSNKYGITIDDLYGYSAPTAACAFALLWAHINGWDSWEANPFVLVTEFTVINGN